MWILSARLRQRKHKHHHLSLISNHHRTYLQEKIHECISSAQELSSMAFLNNREPKQRDTALRAKPGKSKILKLTSTSTTMPSLIPTPIKNSYTSNQSRACPWWQDRILCWTTTTTVLHLQTNFKFSKRPKESETSRKHAWWIKMTVRKENNSMVPTYLHQPKCKISNSILNTRSIPLGNCCRARLQTNRRRASRTSRVHLLSNSIKCSMEPQEVTVTSTTANRTKCSPTKMRTTSNIRPPFATRRPPTISLDQAWSFSSPRCFQRTSWMTALAISAWIRTERSPAPRRSHSTGRCRNNIELNRRMLLWNKI